MLVDLLRGDAVIAQVSYYEVGQAALRKPSMRRLAKRGASVSEKALLRHYLTGDLEKDGYIIDPHEMVSEFQFLGWCWREAIPVEGEFSQEKVGVCRGNSILKSHLVRLIVF